MPTNGRTLALTWRRNRAGRTALFTAGEHASHLPAASPLSSRALPRLPTSAAASLCLPPRLLLPLLYLTVKNDHDNERPGSHDGH